MKQGQKLGDALKQEISRVEGVLDRYIENGIITVIDYLFIADMAFQIFKAKQASKTGETEDVFHAWCQLKECK